VKTDPLGVTALTVKEMVYPPKALAPEGDTAAATEVMGEALVMV